MPAPRVSFAVAVCFGRKSATAAAMISASRPADGRSPFAESPVRAVRTAARIAAVDSARTTRASAGAATLIWPAMRVTRAPRARAASAMATPILPVERLPMNRTGSMASAVPPAVTTMWRPSRSASCAGATTGGRIAGDAARTGRSPTAATTASTIRGNAASRPTPVWPLASGPASGSTME